MNAWMKNSMNVLLLLLFIGSALPLPRPMTAVALPYVQCPTWPCGSQVVPGGTYVLQYPTDRAFAVPDIVLPDNLTIKLPPDWPKGPNGYYEDLRWTATNKLTFGVGCVIDLSPQESLPATPGKAASGARGDYGQRGGNGQNGEPGADGISGVDLVLNVKTWTPSGSLWIRTDGTSGFKAGNGGDGGAGGPGKCEGPFGGGPHGGDGGDGGNGGVGGKGGDTAVVLFQYAVKPGGVSLPGSFCNDGFSPSQPPPPSNNGIVRMYGGPGRGGVSGRGGVGAKGGPGDNCGLLREDRKPGRNGANGQDATTQPANCPCSKCFYAPNGRCRNSYAVSP